MMNSMPTMVQSRSNAIFIGGPLDRQIRLLDAGVVYFEAPLNETYTVANLNEVFTPKVFSYNLVPISTTIKDMQTGAIVPYTVRFGIPRDQDKLKLIIPEIRHMNVMELVYDAYYSN